MFHEDRPKVKVKKDKVDIAIEILTFTLLLFSFLFIGYHYSNLPEQIPAHFGYSGEVNRYDEKSMIWLLPVILSVVCWVIFSLNDYPHLYNYPEKITEENAKKYYKESVKMMRFINLGMAMLSFLVTYETVTIALNNTTRFSLLTNVLILTIVGFMTIIPIIMVFKNIKRAK